MSKIDSKTVEEYQRILANDPNSKVFAVLGEAYRELGIVEQAENILRRGIAKHPTYAAGHLVLAKIFIQKKDYQNALILLEKAIGFAPDNLLAFQLLGETHLLMKNTKEALKAHKMALFLSPTNPRSQKVVESLEKFTADEFEEDLFEMKPLCADNKTIKPEQKTVATENSSAPKKTNDNVILDRGLSFVDALIVRQQGELARKKLLELQSKFPGHSEVISRLQILEADEDIEQAQVIKPIASREKYTIDKKIQVLQGVLKALDRQKESSI